MRQENTGSQGRDFRRRISSHTSTAASGMPARAAMATRGSTLPAGTVAWSSRLPDPLHSSPASRNTGTKTSQPISSRRQPRCAVSHQSSRSTRQPYRSHDPRRNGTICNCSVAAFGRPLPLPWAGCGDMRRIRPTLINVGHFLAAQSMTNSVISIDGEWLLPHLAHDHVPSDRPGVGVGSECRDSSIAGCEVAWFTGARGWRLARRLGRIRGECRGSARCGGPPAGLSPESGRCLPARRVPGIAPVPVAGSGRGRRMRA